MSTCENMADYYIVYDHDNQTSRKKSNQINGLDGLHRARNRVFAQNAISGDFG